MFALRAPSFRLAVQPLAAALAVVLFAGAAAAGPVAARVKAGASIRVCIWPEYYGITFRNPHNQRLSGLDVELSAELGRDLAARIDYVDSSFATLVDDLLADRCDVAMFAVGMLPARMEKLRFTRPYLKSDIYGVTTRANRAVRQWSDIDKDGVVVGVQAGTFMEPVMRTALKRATLSIVKPPATRERELEAGRIDVFMTDYPYSRRLLDNADWAELIAPPAPFHVLPYAYAVKPGDDEWLAELDAFVQRVQRDGRLDGVAARNRLSPIVVR